MDKWLYGYWFKSKKKTIGWGWTVVPNTPQGYVTWAIAVACFFLINFPEMISFAPQNEVMIVSGALLAVATLITFLKTDLREDP